MIWSLRVTLKKPAAHITLREGGGVVLFWKVLQEVWDLIVGSSTLRALQCQLSVRAQAHCSLPNSSAELE